MDTSEIAKLLGKRGGLKTLEKYGKSHFKKLSDLATIALKKKKLETSKKQGNEPSNK